MRGWLLAAIGITLLGLCGGVSLYLHESRSDTKRITAAIHLQLQQQLDADFSPGVAQVKLVDLIKDGSKFDGLATLLVLGKTLVVPFTFQTNGKTSVVDVAGSDLNRVQSSFQDTLQILSGKRSDFILDKRFRALFPVELVRDQALFTKSLGVPDEISEDANYYTGSGCMMHRCGTDAAAWAVDKKTAHMVALVADTQLGMSGSKQISVQMDLYGNPKNDNDLPAPLERWKSNFSDDLTSIATDDGLLSAMRGVEAAHQINNP